MLHYSSCLVVDMLWLVKVIASRQRGWDVSQH